MQSFNRFFKVTLFLLAWLFGLGGLFGFCSSIVAFIAYNDTGYLVVGVLAVLVGTLLGTMFYWFSVVDSSAKL